MTKYLYKVKGYGFRADSLSKDYKTFAEELENLQEDNWEFVSVLTNDKSSFSYLLKKPLNKKWMKDV